MEKRQLKFLLFILIILLIGSISYLLYQFNLISDSETIIEFIQGFGILSYLVFFMIVILEVVVAPIPGAILYTIGGILFGSFIGGTLALLANIIGAAIAFYIGKSLVFYEGETEKRDFLDKMVNKYGGYAIFLLRINPLTSSDVFSFLSGFLKMNFKKFMIGTTLGLLPLIYFQSYLGGEIFTQNQTLFNIFIIASVIYIIIFIYFILNKNSLKWIQKKLFSN